VSTVEAAILVMILLLMVVAVQYIESTQGSADQLAAQEQEVASLKAQVHQLASSLPPWLSSAQNLTFPEMNQPPTIRTIRETWFLSSSAHQDRFDPAFIVVNQGDTVRLTFIDNDTVAHDLVIGPPYNIIMNATVPGLINDLTKQTFTTAARNNSPGVVVLGTPGNVSASYSFVAGFQGIFEFVCTYHAEVGMIGYLVVLPNAAFSTTSTHVTSQPAPQTSSIVIVSGAGGNTSSKGYSPSTITVVLGHNNTISWTNDDASIHTVTANDGSFDSGSLVPGATFTHTFTTPGTYEYHCTYHPWMTGVVIVKSGP